MTDSKYACLSRSEWMEDFIDHVVREKPDAPIFRLSANAGRLYASLGEFDPVDVAEAEWTDLRL